MDTDDVIHQLIEDVNTNPNPTASLNEFCSVVDRSLSTDPDNIPILQHYVHQLYCALCDKPTVAPNALGSISNFLCWLALHWIRFCKEQSHAELTVEFAKIFFIQDTYLHHALTSIPNLNIEQFHISLADRVFKPATIQQLSDAIAPTTPFFNINAILFFCVHAAVYMKPDVKQKLLVSFISQLNSLANNISDTFLQSFAVVNIKEILVRFKAFIDRSVHKHHADFFYQSVSFSFGTALVTKCRSLEAQLLGLKELSQLSKTVTQLKTMGRLSPPNIQSFDESSLARSLVQKGVVDHVLNNSEIHTEIIRKFKPLLLLVARQNELTFENVHKLTTLFQNGHQSVQAEVGQIIGEILPVLSPSHQEELWNDFSQSLPPVDTLLPADVEFICMITKAAKKSLSANRQFGIPILFDALCCGGSYEAYAQSLGQILVELGRSHVIFQNYFALFLTRLSNHNHVVPIISVLLYILRESPITDMSFWANDSNNLSKVILSDLQHYFSKISISSLQSLTDDEIPSQILVPPYSHTDNVKQRLAFLLTLRKTTFRPLVQSELVILWDTLLNNGICQFDNTILYNLLIELEEMGLIVPEMSKLLLEQKVYQFNFSKLTLEGWEFICHFFRTVNLESRALIPESADPNASVFVNSLSLSGEEYLWRTLLESDDILSEVAAQFLIDNLSPNTSAFVVDLFTSFMTKVLTHLQQTCDQFNSGSHDSVVQIHRILSLLSGCLLKFYYYSPEIPHSQEMSKYEAFNIRINFFNPCPTIKPPSCMFNLSLSGNSTVSDLREAIKAHVGVADGSIVRLFLNSTPLFCGSLPLGAIKLKKGQIIVAKLLSSIALRRDDHSLLSIEPHLWHPSILLLKKAGFDTLWKLLDVHQGNINSDAYEILCLLPSPHELVTSVVGLSQPLKEMLDTGNHFKLSYMIDLMNSTCGSYLHQSQSENVTDLMEQSPRIDEESRKLWKDQLIENGEMNHLIDVFHQLITSEFFVFSDKFSMKTLTRFLQLIGRIILHSDFVLHNFPSSDPNSSDRASFLPITPFDVENLNISFDVLVFVSDLCTIARRVSEDQALLLQSLLICVSCFLLTLLESKIFETSFTSLLSSPSASVRAATADVLWFLIQNNRGTLISHEVNAPSWVTNLDIHVEDYIGQILLDLCTKIEANSAKELFNLTISILPILVATHSVDGFGEVFCTLRVLLNSLPSSEHDSHALPDYKLSGIFRVLSTIVSLGGSNVSFQSFVLNDCLFDVAANKFKPKCKTQFTRRCAFDLLLHFSNHCTETVQTVLGRMNAMFVNVDHVSQHWPKTWVYNPSLQERFSGTYCGLRNLSATCYLNSLLQQLYMIPAFRHDLVRAGSVTGEPLDIGKKVFQLQKLFVDLQLSVRKSVDTKTFVENMEDPEGQPLNPYVQMDLHEFLSCLFDKAGEELKNSNLKVDLFEVYFGGSIQHQIIPRCEHKSIRSEGFVALSLPVYGKSDLHGCLELLVEADVLDGSNKYQCDSCDSKITAVKRCLLHELPNTLLLHLRRFDFNFEVMKKIKIYDEISFPLEVDFSEWATDEFSDDYYKYELSGVIIHAGTSDSGHYYAFIRERTGDRKWYLFNDSSVDEVDFPKNYHNWCFGGAAREGFRDPATQRDVPKGENLVFSAYVLVYDRIKPVPEKGHYLDPIVPFNDPLPNHFEKIVFQSNTSFLKDLTIYEPAYHDFCISFFNRLITQSLAQIDPKLVTVLADSFAVATSLTNKLKKLRLSQFSTLDSSIMDVNNAKFMEKFKSVQHITVTVDDLQQIAHLFDVLLLNFYGCVVHSSNRIVLPFFEVLLGTLCMVFPSIAESFILSLSNDGISAPFSHIILSCPVEFVRNCFARIVECALHSCWNSIDVLKFRETSRFEQLICFKFIKLVDGLLQISRHHWRNYSSFFKILNTFASFSLVTKQLLSSMDIPFKLVSYIIADWLDIFYFPVLPRFTTKIKDEKSTADTSQIIEILANILTDCSNLLTSLNLLNLFRLQILLSLINSLLSFLISTFGQLFSYLQRVQGLFIPL
ncbi:hypothetical protein GEMRC1_007855 [Eukaryota sp. GEM-RC1]